MCRCFSADLWELSLRDVWGESFGVLMGDVAEPMSLEAVPEWLMTYRERFRDLSHPQRCKA